MMKDIFTCARCNRHVFSTEKNHSHKPATADSSPDFLIETPQQPAVNEKADQGTPTALSLPEPVQEPPTDNSHVQWGVRKRFTRRSQSPLKTRSKRRSTTYSIEDENHEKPISLKESFYDGVMRNLRVKGITSLDGYDTDAHIIATPVPSQVQSRVDVDSAVEPDVIYEKILPPPVPCKASFSTDTQSMVTARQSVEKTKAHRMGSKERPSDPQPLATSRAWHTIGPDFVLPKERLALNLPSTRLLEEMTLADRRSLKRSNAIKRKPLSNLKIPTAERRLPSAEHMPGAWARTSSDNSEARQISDPRLSRRGERYRVRSHHRTTHTDLSQRSSENISPSPSPSPPLLTDPIHKITIPPRSPTRSLSHSSYSSTDVRRHLRIPSTSLSIRTHSITYTGSFMPPSLRPPISRPPHSAPLIIKKSTQHTPHPNLLPTSIPNPSASSLTSNLTQRKSRFKEEFHLPCPALPLSHHGTGSFGTLDGGNEDHDANQNRLTLTASRTSHLSLAPSHTSQLSNPPNLRPCTSNLSPTRLRNRDREREPGYLPHGTEASLLWERALQSHARDLDLKREISGSSTYSGSKRAHSPFGPPTTSSGKDLWATARNVNLGREHTPLSSPSGFLQIPTGQGQGVSVGAAQGQVQEGRKRQASSVASLEVAPDEDIVRSNDNRTQEDNGTRKDIGSARIRKASAATSISRSTDSWARWPSHTRESRTGSAGEADCVLTRDFAEEWLRARSADLGALGSQGSGLEKSDYTGRTARMADQEGEKQAEDEKEGKSLRHRRVAKKVSRGFLRVLKERWYNESGDPLRWEKGLRSSVSAGGSVKYPDLELLPRMESVYRSVTPEVSRSEEQERERERVKEEGRRERVVGSSNFSGPRFVSSEEDLAMGGSLGNELAEVTPMSAGAWSMVYQDCVHGVPFSEEKLRLKGAEEEKERKSDDGLLSPTYVPKKMSREALPALSLTSWDSMPRDTKDAGSGKNSFLSPTYSPRRAVAGGRDKPGPRMISSDSALDVRSSMVEFGEGVKAAEEAEEAEKRGLFEGIRKMSDELKQESGRL